jgi:tryptophan-rich sensory protein
MEIFIGAAVSVFVQWVKQKSSNQVETLLILLAVSLGAAGIYAALVAVGYWATVASILVYAGAFYAFVIQRFEQPATTQPSL